MFATLTMKPNARCRLIFVATTTTHRCISCPYNHCASLSISQTRLVSAVSLPALRPCNSVKPIGACTLTHLPLVSCLLVPCSLPPCPFARLALLLPSSLLYCPLVPLPFLLPCLLAQLSPCIHAHLPRFESNNRYISAHHDQGVCVCVCVCVRACVCARVCLYVYA
jgi:hypothetical protein